MKQITCPHCGDTYPDFDVAHVCSRGPYAPRLKPKMNERIRKLMTQAETKEIGYYFFDKEKFAELIVRECAKVCRDQPNVYALKADRDNCAVAIEQHFGVE